MTAEKALEALREFLEGTTETNLLVVADMEAEEEPTDNEEVVIQRVTLNQDLAEEFLSSARSAARDREDGILKPYVEGYKPDANEILFMKLGDAPNVKEAVDSIAQVAEAEEFKEEDKVLDHLRAYAIVVQGPKGKRGVFFRVWSPKKELTRSRSFAVMMQKGEYNKVRKRIFLFDHNVDCFAWDGYMFVRSPGGFRRIFRYFEQLVEMAEATIADVTQRIPISNLGEFKEACTGSTLMLAKLSQIAKKPYIETVTLDDIKRTIDEFGLNIPITPDGKLVFDKARENRWKILNLLDDNYLGSTMTQLKYEANSKVTLA
jgi:hypothetical protein